MSDIGERLSAAMADKLVKAVAELEIELLPVEIEELDKDISDALKDALKSDECKRAIQEKVVETIRAIEPKKAAERLTMTWGDLLGEFLYKVVNSFKGDRR